MKTRKMEMKMMTRMTRERKELDLPSRKPKLRLQLTLLLFRGFLKALNPLPKRANNEVTGMKARALGHEFHDACGES